MRCEIENNQRLLSSKAYRNPRNLKKVSNHVRKIQTNHKAHWVHWSEKGVLINRIFVPTIISTYPFVLLRVNLALVKTI